MVFESLNYDKIFKIQNRFVVKIILWSTIENVDIAYINSLGCNKN